MDPEGLPDDADPELKQNDQAKLNTARGRKKGTKNCPKEEKEDKIDPRVFYPSGQKPRSKSQSGKNSRNSSKDPTNRRMSQTQTAQLLAAAQQIHSQLESINNSSQINPNGSTSLGNSTIFESSRIKKNKRNQDERSSTENSPESAKKSRKNDPANLSELCDSLESL